MADRDTGMAFRSLNALPPEPVACGARSDSDPGGDAFHVVPIDDLREHDLDMSCWCHPVDDEGVIVHNSMDGREDYETGRRKVN